ncbi:16267_t:CDS:1, partial [Acaulospora morrowiae]
MKHFRNDNEEFLSDAARIKPRFPPMIALSDLVSNRRNGDVPSRSPNAFMIYRKAFVSELHSKGYYLSMTTASSLASASWKEEQEAVKEEYRRLANEAKSCHLRLFSNKIPRKKRQKPKVRTGTWMQLNPNFNTDSPVDSPVTDTSFIEMGIPSQQDTPSGYSHSNDDTTYFYAPETTQFFPHEFTEQHLEYMGTSSFITSGLGMDPSFCQYNFLENSSNPYETIMPEIQSP